MNNRHSVTSSIRISPTAARPSTPWRGQAPVRAGFSGSDDDDDRAAVALEGLRGSRQLRNARCYLPRCLDAVRAAGRNLRRARMMAFHEGMTPGSSNDGISWPNDGSGPDGKRGSSRDCSVLFAEICHGVNLRSTPACSKAIKASRPEQPIAIRSRLFCSILRHADLHNMPHSVYFAVCHAHSNDYLTSPRISGVFARASRLSKRAWARARSLASPVMGCSSASHTASTGSVGLQSRTTSS